MPSLTRDEAIERAALLRVYTYRIDLDLTAALDADTFVSTTTVRFACARANASTFVDLTAVSVDEVRLNGRPLDPASAVGNRMPLSGLVEGDNELLVRARLAYSRTGEGLHRFVDPSDGLVYVYAQAGPDLAGRIFACFD